MKKVALSIAAVLVLAVVSPAFSQPFADVPTDHWAFDAIAELAAKGLVEGYPDGTFKGDRAMTRYEMAMVVARILARVEAIKIPPPPPPVKIPPPEVTRADFQTLQRLINEFRAELAALGVRVTAVEEELAALRARLDNTFITGNIDYVYEGGNAGAPATVRNRARLTFRGRVSSTFQTFLRARYNSNFTGGASSFTTDFDRLYMDYAAPFGWTFRLGRDYWGLGPFSTLLYGASAREGVRAMASLGPISFTALAYWNQANATSTTFAVRGEMAPVSGWTLGVNYRTDRDPWSVLPAGYVAGTSATPTYRASGWSIDWSGDIIPGLTFGGEYASFAPEAGCPAAGGVPNVAYGCTALFAQLTLGAPILPGPIEEVNVWYKNFQAYYPTAQTYTYETHTFPYWLGGNGRLVTGWGGDVTIALMPNVTLQGIYESARDNNGDLVPAGNSYSSWGMSVYYSLGSNARIGLEYNSVSNTTTSTNVFNTYAVVVRHSW